MENRNITESNGYDESSNVDNLENLDNFDDFSYLEPYHQPLDSTQGYTTQSSDTQFDYRSMICILIIIFSNIIIHLYLGSDDSSFYLRGVNYDQLFINHAYGRLISHMFIHANARHLFSNMLSLFFLGQLVEKNMGSFRTTIIYFLSGISSGLITAILDHMLQKDSAIYSAGASGAVYGIMCSAVVITLKEQSGGSSRNIKLGIILTVLYAILTFQPGVAIWSHIGGAVVGGILTFILSINRWNDFKENIFLKSFAIIITIIFCFMGYGEANNRTSINDIPDERKEFITNQLIFEDDTVTYGELLNKYTKNPKWFAFVTDEKQDVVDFKGQIHYQNKDRQLHMQFVIEDETYYITYFALDDVPQTKSILSDFFQFWINQYKTEIN